MTSSPLQQPLIKLLMVRHTNFSKEMVLFLFLKTCFWLWFSFVAVRVAVTDSRVRFSYEDYIITLTVEVRGYNSKFAKF